MDMIMRGQRGVATFTRSNWNKHWPSEALIKSHSASLITENTSCHCNTHAHTHTCILHYFSNINTDTCSSLSLTVCSLFLLHTHTLTMQAVTAICLALSSLKGSGQLVQPPSLFSTRNVKKQTGCWSSTLKAQRREKETEELRKHEQLLTSPKTCLELN